MSVRVWRTTEAPGAGFRQAWLDRLSRAPHANFTMDPRYLEWEARHGRGALAALVDERGARGAFVLRESGRWLVSGWPWRWQAVVEDPSRVGPSGLGEAESAWLLGHARSVAEGRDLRWFAPAPPPRGTAGYHAGSTVLQSIAHDDAELIEGMRPAKRRQLRRAERAGYAVRLARDAADFRAFAALQAETKRRHGLEVVPVPEGDPGEGQHWREWELPWMWLLVGELGGRIECGVGDGLYPGGCLEARAGTTSARARADGAFTLLSYVESRYARDLGYRWINLGGATRFKLEVAGALGTVVHMHVWLAGPARGTLERHREAAWNRLHRAARTAVRRRHAAAASGFEELSEPAPVRSGAGGRDARTWSTREPMTPEFREAWDARLSRAPHAHYGMRLDWLAWEARHGRHGVALLLGDPPAAVVLREAPGGWKSGWPWRAQVVIEDPSREEAAGITPVEALGVFERVARECGTRRLRLHLPGGLPPGLAGFRAGLTVHQSLGPDEAVLLRQLDDAKRRNLKRAARDGFTVTQATREEQFRAFQALQRQAERRRGHGGDAAPRDGRPESGESWREWELPWQWLLVAERDGVVEAGSGFGLCPGSTLDYRTNASSAAARKSGANILLGWEGIRRGRELGHRRLNWGGATRFKRELGGEPIEVWCVLGGGTLWAVPNGVAASWKRMRPRIVGWWRSLRPRSTSK